MPNHLKKPYTTKLPNLGILEKLPQINKKSLKKLISRKLIGFINSCPLFLIFRIIWVSLYQPHVYCPPLSYEWETYFLLSNLIKESKRKERTLFTYRDITETAFSFLCIQRIIEVFQCCMSVFKLAMSLCLS